MRLRLIFLGCSLVLCAILAWHLVLWIHAEGRIAEIERRGPLRVELNPITDRMTILVRPLWLCSNANLRRELWAFGDRIRRRLNQQARDRLDLYGIFIPYTVEFLPCRRPK